MPIPCEYPVESRTDRTLLRIVGHCEYLNCAPLRKFLDFATAETNRREIVLEMSDCLSIDSTALGLVAKAALNLHRTPGRRLVLANLRIGPRRTALRLGIGHLAQIEDIPEYRRRTAPAETPASPPAAAADRETIREAHEALMEIRPGNRATFADVASFLGTVRTPRASA